MVDRQAHAVSEADRDATRHLLAATPGLVGEPSDAERSRTLVAMATHATLATVAADRAPTQTPAAAGAGNGGTTAAAHATRAADRTATGAPQAASAGGAGNGATAAPAHAIRAAHRAATGASQATAAGVAGNGAAPAATQAPTAADRAAGYPFGSLVACAADDAGRVVLCLSDLAVHAVNLAVDPRASVLVAADAAGDPLAAARVTLVGDLREVPEAERAAVREEYRRVHADAFYAGFADFRVYRLEPTAVRYVGGFGRMSWVSADEYRAAAPDPLRSHADGILDHMNDDHADALVAFCRVLGERPEVTEARMVGVDRYGFDVLATTPSTPSPRAIRFGFDVAADTTDAVRAAMIGLVRRTR
jgi:heme iron utilization protein